MDLYNIPGDNGKLWRIDKLIEYKQIADYADIPVLAEYSKYLKNEDEAILVAWFFSLTYSEPSTFWLLDNFDYFDIDKSGLTDFWKTYKENLPFCSSRQYCKNMDWFVPLMGKFMATTKRHPYRWFNSLYNIQDTPEKKYEKIFSTINSWKYMGRFSSELFMLAIEAISENMDIPKIYANSPPFSWKKGSNVTSGMLNLLYLDEEANAFDKSGKFDKDLEPILNKGVKTLYKRCAQKDLKIKDYTTIIPRICSFRNLFKGNRYVGFHQDRQLEGIISISKLKGTNLNSIDLLYDIRKQLYPKYLLGELNNWSGTRKERKKLFLNTGELI